MKRILHHKYAKITDRRKNMAKTKTGRLLALVTTMMLILSLFTTAFAEGNDLSEYNNALAAVNEADYTAESWTAYQETVISNEASEDDEQSVIDEKTANIVAAQSNLEAVSTESVESVDFTEYNDVTAAVSEEDYSVESWAIYMEILAENEMTEENSQEEVDAAVANIIAAQDELIELPEGTVTTSSAIKIKESIVVYDIINGYVTGYEDGTFRPDRNITRAEIAQLLSGIIFNEGTNDFELTDISGQWYTEAVEKIVKLGIMQGQGNGVFGPDKNMTRQDFAIAIVNMLDTSAAGNEDVSFTDIENSYGKSSIEYLASIGVINGYEDGTFRPNGEITRAEAVAMINRLLAENLADVQADASLFSDLSEHWAENDVLTAAVIILIEEEN